MKIITNYKETHDEFRKDRVERISESLGELNKSFKLNLNGFKRCLFELNVAGCQQLFENIGSLKYPVLQPSEAMRNATLS